MARVVAWLSVLSIVGAQQRGPLTKDEHPQLPVKKCTKEGCDPEAGMITMDMNWRWLHNIKKYNNCFTDKWDAKLCPDPVTCAKDCATEGMKLKDYAKDNYGVTDIPMGVSLQWPPGSRFYMMTDDETYKIFKLKNREISMTVDLSTLPCGMNGAIYFVEMAANGGKDGDKNTAGASQGTGYCDAQCPRMKFIDGEANMLDMMKHRIRTPELKILKGGLEGKYGSCCAEVDIIEANQKGNQFTMHPCNFNGQKRCEGDDCGNGLDQNSGVCDKPGCGFNSFQLGDEKFWGPGSEFTVDTTKPVTLVTQFVTSDNTDSGDLTEIRRLYVQDGKVIQNSKASVLGDEGGNSITDAMCSKVADVFKENAHDPKEEWTKSFELHGGLKAIGDAFDRGMVLAFSIWDDPTGRMLWLDGEKARSDDTPGDLGISTGPCPFKEGSDEALKKDLKDNPAFLNVTDLKYGAIDSTYEGAQAQGKFAVISDQDGSLRQGATEHRALTAKHLLLAAVMVSFAVFAVVARQLRWWHLAFGRGDVQALPTREQEEFE